MNGVVMHPTIAKLAKANEETWTMIGAFLFDLS